MTTDQKIQQEAEKEYPYEGVYGNEDYKREGFIAGAKFILSQLAVPQINQSDGWLTVINKIEEVKRQFRNPTEVIVSSLSDKFTLFSAHTDNVSIILSNPEEYIDGYREMKEALEKISNAGYTGASYLAERTLSKIKNNGKENAT